MVIIALFIPEIHASEMRNQIPSRAYEAAEGGFMSP